MIQKVAPPYIDCIQWAPRRFSGGTSPVTIADIVISQPVVAEMTQHLRDADGSAFGLLVGQVFEDPTCSRRWSRIARAVRGGPAGRPTTVEELERLTADALGAVRETECLVGWYATHQDSGLYLSSEEAEFHRGRFPEAWQSAVILTGSGGRVAGGVFQRTDPEGLSRSVYAPFYEHVEAGSGPAGPTRRTFVGWTNYQTDARVVFAGPDAISPAAPQPAESTPPDVSATPPWRMRRQARTDLPYLTTGSDPVVAPGVSTAAVGPPESAPREKASSEAAWDQRQIDRSLMAVGRSLTPSSLGELGAPVGDHEFGRVEDVETDVDAHGGVDSATRPTPTVSASPAGLEVSELVVPIARGSSTGAFGSVGRARRRSRVPAKWIVSSVAALAIVSGIGWIGSIAMARRGAGVAADPGVPPEGVETSRAGLNLSPAELFDRGGGVAPSGPPTSTDEPADPEATVRPEGGGSEAETGSPTTRTADSTDPVEVGPEVPDGSASQPANDEPAVAQPAVAQPAPPPPLAAPDLSGLSVGDPAASAYHNAMEIFRKEVDRYGAYQRDFDAGVLTCNPLNLSYRGVRDAFGRLERRFSDVDERLAAPDLRSFDGGRRQYAVIETHYGLTDCPPPIGG